MIHAIALLSLLSSTVDDGGLDARARLVGRTFVYAEDLHGALVGNVPELGGVVRLPAAVVLEVGVSAGVASPVVPPTAVPFVSPPSAPWPSVVQLGLALRPSYELQLEVIAFRLGVSTRVDGLWALGGWSVRDARRTRDAITIVPLALGPLVEGRLAVTEAIGFVFGVEGLGSVDLYRVIAFQRIDAFRDARLGASTCVYAGFDFSLAAVGGE